MSCGKCGKPLKKDEELFTQPSQDALKLAIRRSTRPSSVPDKTTPDSVTLMVVRKFAVASLTGSSIGAFESDEPAIPGDLVPYSRFG